jgi:hypothetical protein
MSSNSVILTEILTSENSEWREEIISFMESKTKEFQTIMKATIEKTMTEKKELSGLARQILGNSGAVEFYTQQEFDAALTVAKAEIMTVAIQTSKQAIMIERQACAELVMGLANEEDEGEASTALKNAAYSILNRIPSQRQ